MCNMYLTFEDSPVDVGILWSKLLDISFVEGEIVAGPSRSAILHPGRVFPLVRTAHLKVIIKLIQSLCFYKST